MLKRHTRRRASRAAAYHPPRACEQLEARRLLSADGRITATLDAPPINLWETTYVFRVTYTDDVSVNTATLDNNDLTIRGPNGFTRPARFHRFEVAQGGRIAYAWYKISAPGGVWDAADNGGYHVWINPHQVRDHDGNSARAVRIGHFAVNVPRYPTDIAIEMATKGIIGVDVTKFGAKPDDGIDDTDAIQRAIDSLPRNGDGVPNAQFVQGGIVVFPAGTFNTSKPLKIPPAVRLRGQGEATIILNNSIHSNEGALELTTWSPSGYNNRAGVENLKIVTAAAKGIRATRMNGDLLGLRLSDLTISAGGVAIDLREDRTYGSELRNITIEDPGSTALWLGPSDDGWISNVNRISGFRVIGTARANFAPERAMVVIGGELTVDGLRIADTAAPVTPLYVAGAATFLNLSIDATRNLPGGVQAVFENASLEIDRLDSIAAGRKLQLINVSNLNISSLSVTPGAHLSESLIMDGRSNLTVGVLRSAGNAGAAPNSRVVIHSHAGLNAAPVLEQRYNEPFRPVSQTVVDVTHFGATANDGSDDTQAIQQAIDALPKGSGIPGVGEEYTGGLVIFPAGQFDVSGPLLVPSGVWLRGQGNATVIYNTSTDPGRGTIEFVSTHSHGFNAGAAIEDMSIYTTVAHGIRGHSSISAGLVDPRISGVQISAGGRAMDLSDVRTFHALISNVMVSIPGSTALWLGDRDGYSADNRVIGLTLYGGARPNFVPEKAIVVLRGDTLFQSGWIEAPWTPALPLHVSGAATIRGLWLEYAPELLPNRVVAQFQDTTRIEIDRLTHISAVQQVHLINARNVRINMLGIEGRSDTLRDTVAVDSNSRLSIGMVVAQRDSGLLDHPRVRVESAYNIMDRTLLQNRPPAAAQNMVADPKFQAFGQKQTTEPFGDAASLGWSVMWGDTEGRAHGTASIEQTSAGPRLKVVITDNPHNRPVYIVGRILVPTSMIGQHAVAWWRLEGAPQALVYMTHANIQNEFSARAINGLTSGTTASPLRPEERILFLLPRQPGTYYLSKVSLVPA